MEQLLLEETIDLKLLLQESRVKGGFQSNELRRSIWPKLLRINRFERGNVVFVDGVGHRDKDQCSCDVERSFQTIHPGRSPRGLSTELILNRRLLLEKIIMTVLFNNSPHLYYYQGLNDIFAAVILVLQDEQLAFLTCEAIALQYLSDYMHSTFSAAAVIMSLIFKIIEEVDFELFTFIKSAEVEPFFATSWLVTWFSHDLKDLSKIARVFDCILTSTPLFSVYLCAAVVLHNRKGVMQCPPDIASVHSFLGTTNMYAITKIASSYVR